MRLNFLFQMNLTLSKPGMTSFCVGLIYQELRPSKREPVSEPSTVDYRAPSPERSYIEGFIICAVGLHLILATGT